MEFELSEEQEHLRDGARAFLEQACPPSAVRKVFDTKPGAFDAKSSPLWLRMIDLDWPALNVPEANGGLGLGPIEVALVVEEMGRVVAPSPYLATATQFVPVVRETGTEEQREAFLRPVAEGRSTGTVAIAEAAGRWEAGVVEATATRAGGGWRLEGTKRYVMDGATADEIVVVARAPGSSGWDGLGVFVVPGDSLASTVREAKDPSQPLADLALGGVSVPDDRVLVEPGDGRAAPAIRRAVQEAVAAMAMSMTGTCRVIFETTLQYAKDREQYGRPIGSFQALKHRLVQMYLAVERANALCYFAAMTIAEDDERRAMTPSIAKAAAGECQRLVVQDGLQLHGGIGYTWEHDLHMFLKRAKSGDFLFGSAAVHRAEVARQLGVAA